MTPISVLSAAGCARAHARGSELRCAVATFTPVDLSTLYTHSRSDSSPWEEKTAWGIARLPGGEQRFWGVPFSLGSAEPESPGLLVIGGDGSQSAARVPLEGAASYVVLAHFCDARARATVAG